MKYRLELYRISSQEDSSNGILYKEDNGKRKFLAYTLEDEKRLIKVRKETRIPEGTYRIALRKTGGFHEKYKQRFKDIHKGMLLLTNVHGFEYILIHCGNTDEDTAGCILVGNSQKKNTGKNSNGFVGESGEAYKDIYPEIAQAIEDGKEVTITIIDFA
jgi:hypothetical protein